MEREQNVLDLLGGLFFSHMYKKQKSGVALIRHLLTFVVATELLWVALPLSLHRGQHALLGTVGWQLGNSPLRQLWWTRGLGDSLRPEPYQRPDCCPSLPQLTPKAGEMSYFCCISHRGLEFPVLPKVLLLYFFFNFRGKKFKCKAVLDFFLKSMK